MNKAPTVRPWHLLAFAALLGVEGVLLGFSIGGPQGAPMLPWLATGTMALTVAVAIAVLGSLQRASRRALLAQRTLEEAIDALPASVEIFDRRDRLIAYNRRLVELYPHMLRAFEQGASFEEMARESLARGGVPEACGREAAWLAERLQERGRRQLPLLQRVHGELWLHIFERRTPSGGIVGVRLDVSDLIHEQQRLAASQAQLKAIIRAAMNGILTLDPGGHVLEVNPSCEDLFGFTAAELQGVHLGMLFHGAGHLMPQDLLSVPQELAARHRSGAELTLQVSVSEVRTETTLLYVCVVTDFSERKRQEMRLQRANELLARQSTTDGLTGVGNRRLFDQLLQNAWLRSARTGLPLALLMVDIDHFKQYNDRYGHVAGDDCLRRVAALLRSCVGGESETVCRYGGEEFALLLAEVDLDGARSVAQRCLDSVRLAAIEHEASPGRRTVSLSIGVALQVGCAQAPALRLIEAADAALYQAKAGGRGRLSCQVQQA